VQQFLAGFVVVVLSAVAIVWWFLLDKKRRDTARARQNAPAPQQKNHTEEVEGLTRLIGELAHEIKNPLSTVKVNLALIGEELTALKSAAPAAQPQALARALRKIAVIQKETDRLEQILEGFLGYVDKTGYQLSRVDVNSLVGDMVDFYSPQAYSRSITLRQGLCAQPLVCKADIDSCKRVLLNLFINAQQAMSGGGELIIKTYQSDNNAIIEVSDTGCGIAPDKIEHVFEAYYSSRPHGTGLGLATAKKIIDAHNGHIHADSTVGKGSRFTISLPLHVIEAAIDE